MSLKDKLKGMVKETLGFSGSSSGSGGTETWYITVERAEGLKDNDKITKSDPYVKLSFAGKSYKTKVVKNDRSPAWNETFQFQVKPGTQHTIQVKVMDSDVGLDDTIGEATIGGMDLPDFSGQEKMLRVNIQRKGQMTGLLHLRVRRVNPNMPMQGGQPQSYGQPQGYHHQQQPQYAPQGYQNQPQYQQYPSHPPPPQHQQQQPYQGGYHQSQPHQSYGYQQPYQQSNQYR